MLESEDLATAEEEFVRAEETCRREKARRELAQVLLARTELALDLGSFERAWPLLEESFSIIEEIGLGDFQPTYYRLRANLVSTGTHPDLPVARRLLERGLEEAENLDIPEETWRIYRDLDDRGWDVLAIYHSPTHTEAKPSATDIRLAAWPEAYYLIVSLADEANPVIRAFRIEDGEVSEEELEVV